MPRGRKKKEVKPKAKKIKKVNTKSIKEEPKKINVSKEIQEIFFNDNIEDKDDEDGVDETPSVDLDGEIDVSEIDLNKNLLEDDEVVNATKEKDTVVDTVNSEGEEQFVVSTSFSDDGEEIYNVHQVRINLPPKESWADKHAKFKSGQRIMPKSLKPSDYASYECATVISAGSTYDTYQIKNSRAMNETTVYGRDWVLADPACKPYVSYWEVNSPIIKVKK